MKIFLNAGHGGKDPGAIGNGLMERDVVLSIAQRAEKYLRDVGFEVKTFQYDGLQTICDDANAFKADIFISIHCNAGGGKGAETYYSTAAGKELASAIQNQLIRSLPLVDRGIKTGNLYVLKHTQMPAVLVETAFIDNTWDAMLLKEKEDEFARAIARGVTDYEMVEPAPDVLDEKEFSEHFSPKEFECHCCGGGREKISPRLIELLEELRGKANAPVHVNCGYRCEKHNREVGGVANSQHVKGTAADITIPQISFVRAMDLVRALPFDGTGFYSPLYDGGAWFIHVDCRDGGIGSHIEWFE